MKPEGIQLSWIVVADIRKAIKFYTEIVGLNLREFNENYGWAELSGEKGMRLGIAQYHPEQGFKPGSNAIPTITVEDIEESREEFSKKNVQLLGEVMEVPGEVKIQTFCDADGNHFQLCELLR